MSCILLSLLCMQCSHEKQVTNADVPDAVKLTFQIKYNNAPALTWEMEDTIYEAHFTFNNKKMEAEFTASGKFIKER